MAEKEKQSFVIYRNWMEMVMGLPDSEALDLTRTIFAYCLNRDYEPDPVAAAIFDTIEPLLEGDIAKWHHTCDERRKAGSLGGKQKVANAKQLVANAKQNVADNENEYDTVTVNDNVTVTEENIKKEEAIASKKEIVDALIAKWNSYGDRGKIPTVRSVSCGGKTWKSILARVQEYGLDAVVETMDRVFASDYLRGFKTDWCAKFDWMMLPSNFEKIANGNYDNTSSVKVQSNVLSAWMERYGEA